MKLGIKWCVGVCALVLSLQAFAVTTISFFGGNNYVIGNKNAWSLEFLYGGAWKYGDNLFFFDVTNPHRNTTTITGDWVSRLSYHKTTGKEVHIGPISDIALATQLNVTGLNDRAYGLGLGADFTVPKFKMLTLDAFWLHNDHHRGSTYQFVGLWTLPIALSERFHMVFGGVGEYTGPVGTLKNNLLLEPSLMLDLGNVFNLPSQKLYLGLQYAYWHNMLGIKGVTESVPEIKLTWNIG